MKWVALKSKNLPIVALQIDRAIQVFTGSFAITQKAENSRSNDDLDELDLLKKDFERRVSQLDAYYKQHYLDQNISIFHMLRMKLERAVFISNRKIADVMSISKKQSLFSLDEPLFKEPGSIKILDQPLFTYYENSLKNDNSDIKRKLSIKKQQKNHFQSANSLKRDKKGPDLFKNTKNAVQKPVKKDKQFKNLSPKTKTKELITKDPVKLKTQQKERESQFNTASFGGKGKNNGTATPNFKSQSINPSLLLQQMKKSSELTFTIKMTKQEYKSLLSIKNQLKDSSK